MSITTATTIGADLPTALEADQAKHAPAATRIRSASAWAMGESLASAGLRLGSNLVLARLLVPDSFGLMSIAVTLMQGLQMFSDIGTRPAILAHRRGEDPSFLDTAWTMQVARGLVLWVAVLALAVPAGVFYGDRRLAPIIAVAGVSVLISGFNSTALFTLNRKLMLRRLAIRAIGSQAMGAVVMVAWAWWWPSPWALVAGGIVDSACNMVLSHRLVERHRCRLRWDRQAAGELIRFGRWIFLSTLLTFVAERSDRLIAGKMLTIADLGVYSVALLLSQQALKFVRQYASRVLLAAYARFHELGTAEFRARLLSVRRSLLAVTLPVVWGLILGGEWVVGLLYPENFHAAGWMLRVLSIGSAAGVVICTMQPVLLSRGDSFGHLVCTAGQALLLLASMLTGWATAGQVGLIVGIAASSFLLYPIVAWRIHRHSAWQPGLDSAAMTATGLISMLSLSLSTLQP